MLKGCHRCLNEGLVQGMEIREGEQHISAVLLLFRNCRKFFVSFTDVSTDFENQKCSGDFLWPAYTTMAEKGEFLPILLPPCQQKGEGNFLNKIRLFLPQYLPLGCLPELFSKAFVLLDTPIIFSYILYQVGRLTVQKPTDSIKSFPRNKFIVP